jgi:hypothetical protein
MCCACPVLRFRELVGAACVVFMSLPALGVVLHTDDQPADRPSDDVVGRWGSNASCVLISPNVVLTTRHQGGGVGTAVEIGGQTYLVEECFDHYKADLRTARIVKPDDGSGVITEWALDEWARAYAGTSDTKRTVVIGGYGLGRGSTMYTDGGVPYAYAWGTGGNSTFRWGANYVDVPVWEFQVGLLRSKGLRADFDDIGQDEVAFEAAPALHDSGCGWFIQEDGQWYVVGLSAFVEHQNETWFRNATTGEPDADYLYAVRVGGYTDWIIDSVVSSCPIPGDANNDGLVGGADYTVLFDHLGQTGLPPFSEGGWVFANFNDDDVVNGCDYTFWADHYVHGGGGTGIPEPATAVLLALSGLTLIRRRRT